MNDQWAGAHWFKAEVSGDHGCVEVAFRGDRVGVRDSKAKGAGDVLEFDRHEWECFLAGAKAGEFDLPD